MKPKRIVILAGHQRSLASIALAETLARLPHDEVSLAGVISVSPYSINQLRTWRRRFGSQIAKKILSQFGMAGGSQFVDESVVYSKRLEQLGVAHRSLRSLCRQLDVPLRVVREINSVHTIKVIKQLQPDLAVYSGAGILRKPVIDSFAYGILNLHCGPLPHVRGMNAVEWSLFLGLQPEVTLHKIDTGIDTGAVLASRTIDVAAGDALGTIRARTVLAGIDLLVAKLPTIDERPTILNPPQQGRQYFTMADPVKQLVQTWIDQRITPVSISSQINPDDTRPATLRSSAA
jgi:methionyl-tRNA formyltransferase